MSDTPNITPQPENAPIDFLASIGAQEYRTTRQNSPRNIPYATVVLTTAGEVTLRSQRLLSEMHDAFTYIARQCYTERNT